MVRVKRRKGSWHKSALPISLYYEECPNTACPSDELHYPINMIGAHCADCKAKLIGRKLVDTLISRINYHLGAVV